MTIPQSGNDRKEWAAAVAALTRNLIRAGVSGEELSKRIGAAKWKTTAEIQALAEAARLEAEAND